MFHQSADLYMYEKIKNFIINSKPTNLIFIDLYSENNDITSGRDNRLAVVQPFNWYILNSRGKIYVHSTTDICDGGKDTFLQLNNPLLYSSLKNINKVCLSMSISSMITHFADKIKTRLYMNVKQDKITVIDVINYLLLKGGIKI